MFLTCVNDPAVVHHLSLHGLESLCCRCRNVDELSLTVVALIGRGELFATGECSEIPPVVWAIIFGNLTMSTGYTVEEFFEQMVCSQAAMRSLAAI